MTYGVADTQDVDVEYPVSGMPKGANQFAVSKFVGLLILAGTNWDATEKRLSWRETAALCAESVIATVRRDCVELESMCGFADYFCKGRVLFMEH